MPEISIRPAYSSDVPRLIALDHNYATEFVWQMTLEITEMQTQVTFREVRLPREVHVNYPRVPESLADLWTTKSLLLLAEQGEQALGYISIRLDLAPVSAWVEDLVVDRLYRQQGIGTALVLAAQDWAGKKGLHRMILEMQPKNYPGIQFAHKLGFDFSGYNDQFYRDQEIALFFSSYI